MNTDDRPRSYEVFKGPPSDVTPADKQPDNSYTNQPETKKKDESESYMDYNGNSEQNAPARSE